MRKLNVDEEKSDGLEITSIGSLYAGPWDKKYWSSSRGKDRYPYPVGYEAVRAYDESTYKMEIQEGQKGPSFMIASADGNSSSGQTPDIAWDQFQKKYCPGIKILQGNRKKSSSNINGVEFFGFKNPSVQRLLREMVANVSGSSEHVVLRSSFSKESPNLPPSSKTQKVTGKRSKRPGITNTVSSTKAERKKSRLQDPSFVAEASHPTEKDQITLDIGRTNNSLDMDQNEIPSMLPQSLGLILGQEEKCHVAENDVSLADVDNSKQQKGYEEKPLDRSQSADVENIAFPLALDVKDGEIEGPGNRQILNYAPDSFNVEHDDIPDTDPSALDKDNEKSTEEVVIVSEGPRSNPDEDRVTSNSNVGTEKSESDSVDHETAKSMMTFLLPQALPLLEKTTRKKKAAMKKQTETGPSLSGLTEKKMSDMKADVKLGSTNIDSAIAVEKICGDEVSDKTNFSTETRHCNKCGQCVGNGEHNDSLDCYLETHGSKDILSHNDVHMNSSIKVPLCDAVSMPIQSCNEPCKKDSSAETEGTVIGIELKSQVQGLLRSSTKQLEQPASQTEAVETGTELINQVQKLVYTRRKKVKAEKQTKEIYNRPLSESIICRRSIDDSITETCETESNSVAVHTLETGYSDDKSYKKDPCDAQPKKFEQFKSSITVKTDFAGIFETVGFYIHPIPVLSLMVSNGHGEIRICVICGNRFNNKTTLFIYKIAIEEPTFGHPSFIGHTSVTFPNLKDYFGREISLERSSLQFTPEGQNLVMIDSIRTPHCRERRIPCLCSECASESFEGDAVKIVKVEFGYVSLVTKLKADESLQCLLVCEPSHVVAVGESGRLHLWVMKSIWSEYTEAFVMPANDRMLPGIVGLKRIPTCASLIIGHNGFGEFSLWDISKRSLVSKFSGSSTSIFDFIPVGLFQWEKDDHIYSKNGVDGHVKRMIAATNERFSEQTENGSFLPSDEDISVWLLVSGASDSDSQPDYMSGDYETKSARCWRLVLLLKNMVISGSALDPSATSVGTSGCHGIIGTGDGLVFIWDMLTGTKLGNLHHFKGNKVSCIASDSSKKGSVAVAGGDGQLVVYVPHRKLPV